MTADELDKRQAIIDACRRMNALGIDQGTSRNTSVRHVDGLSPARQHHGGRRIGQPPLLTGAGIERVSWRIAGDGLAEG